jgi:hypothetical protein
MKLVIAIPCSWENIQRDVVQNLLAITAPSEINKLSRLGFTEHAIIFDTSFPLDLSRNRLTRLALEMNADSLLFLDADMVYPRGMIYDLLAEDVDVISPLYFKKAPPFAPVAGYFRADDPDLIIPIMEPEGSANRIIEVDVTGCGGMLIKREILERIGHPWFEYKRYSKTGEMVISEDVIFCKKVQDAGGKIYITRDVKAGHVTMQVINSQNWHQYRMRTYEYGYSAVVNWLWAMGR